jgi:hypothetical protein
VKILGLLLRHFLVCLAYWWVETQIRVISRFSSSVVRWQVRLIRFSGLFGLLTLALILTGCATAPIPQPTYAPSSSAVLRAVTAARQSASALQSQVSTPEGIRTLSALNASLDSSLLEVASYSAKVDAVSVALSKAEESATYWHAKQAKALKELWFWRLVILTEIGCVIGWIAFKGGIKTFLP